MSNTKELKQLIDDRLDQINHSMSTYRKDSEISRFNRINDAATRFTASEEFFDVMSLAWKLHAFTDGAWDGTVDPLVTLWGFGRKGAKTAVPKKNDIEAALSLVGFERIDISDDHTFRKQIPGVTVDLASIAKGFGVDEISKLLRNQGYNNFIAEIGGEVYASGTRKDNVQWRVGINRPVKEAALDDVYKVINLKNLGFATSGDYRIFFETDGKRYSHIIDPRTGYPVSNGIASVSVLAPTCAFADGLATAIMVMGAQEGLALVNRLKEVECYIVTMDKEGTLTDHVSNGFLTEN